VSGRRALHRLAPVALAAAAICASAPTAHALPRIALIATGGTIANDATGRLSAARLAEAAPRLAGIAQVEPETFARGASLSLSLNDWLRLSRRIEQRLGDAGLSGIVVTSGTDTLEELAWFLQLTVKSSRPIVLTGAMRRPDDPEADGPVNLRHAVRVAADRTARPLGVVVVFGGKIHGARDVTKVSTSSTDAFSSGGRGPLGAVDDDGVHLASGRADRRPGRIFDLRGVRRLPRVDILLTYQQAPGDLLEASLAGGAEGLVLAGAGAGAITRAQSSAARQAMKAGVPIVVASRVLDGQVAKEATAKNAGLIPAGDLAPAKARILLMVALAAGWSRDEIAAIFAKL
jgi:L-asparaginase